MSFTQPVIRKSYRSGIWAGLIALCIAAPTALAADLTVTVAGVHGGPGKVVFGLYVDPKEWPKGHAAYDAVAPTGDDSAVYVFKALPPGRYALTGYYDENNNGKMDFSFIGLPEEGFFFSNDRSPGLSTPSFDACAVTIGDNDSAMTVHIQHWGG